MSDDFDSHTPAPQDRGERSRSTKGRTRTGDMSETRARPAMDRWAPPSLLEMPDFGPDYEGRWIAEWVNGQKSTSNVQMALRNGYRRVNIAELPEDFVVDEDEQGDGVARRGGLLLMKIPTETKRRRDAYFRERREEARYSVDTLQGVPGANTVVEDRGSRTLKGVDASRALQQMSR